MIIIKKNNFQQKNQSRSNNNDASLNLPDPSEDDIVCNHISSSEFDYIPNDIDDNETH